MKYIISNTAVEPEERDRFHALRHARTYRNLKTREPEVGERGVYTVELDEDEALSLEKDRPSNLRSLEKDFSNAPHVDAAVPSPDDLKGHRSDKLFEWGYTGQGIDVGVIDDGLGSGIAQKFNVKASQSFGGSSNADHGSPCAAIAVPRRAQLVFGSIGESYLNSDAIEALYWMVDEVGVHVVNMSFGGAESSTAFSDAIQNAVSKGVVPYASAGNDSSSTPQFPANYAGVEVVGALDRFNGWRRASFSNFGPWVDLWMNGVNLAAYDANGNSTLFSGTSAATPLAVFVWASLATKGLESIGPEGVTKAIKDGGVPREGAKIGRGEDGAYAMRNYCA